MKAIRVPEFASPLQIEEVSDPAAWQNQIVVCNLATGFNPIAPIASGRASGPMRQIFPLQFPWAPGGDVSGIVEKVGESVAGRRKALDLHAEVDAYLLIAGEVSACSIE